MRAANHKGDRVKTELEGLTEVRLEDIRVPMGELG